MQRISILFGTLSLLLSMSTPLYAQDNSMPALSEIDCVTVPFVDSEQLEEEAPDLVPILEECQRELDLWVDGHPDLRKNGLLSEEAREEIEACFFCATEDPVLRVTIDLDQLANLPDDVEPEILMTSRELTTGDEEEHEPISTSDTTYIFQFSLDLDLPPRGSEVVTFDVESNVPRGVPMDETREMESRQALILRQPQPPAAGNTCAQSAPGTPSKAPLALLPGLLLAGLGRRRARRHDSSTERRGRWASWLVALSLLLMPSMAFGQEEEKQMNTEQINLLNEANAALGEGDLEKAHAAIEQALEKGERFDVLLLTQGRVLQKQDKCQQAKKVFGEINVAPHAPSFTKADINRLKERYISQMGEMCSAKLKIDCLTEDTEVKLLGEVRECGSTIKLKEGGYQLIATRGKTTKAYDVSLEGGEEKTFTVALEDIPDTTSGGGGETKVVTVIGVEDPDRPPYRRTIVSGVTFGVLAAASGVTALIFRNMNQETSENLDENYYQLGPEGNPTGWKEPDREFVEEGRELEAERDQQYAVALGTGLGAGVLAVAGIATTTALFIGDRKRAKRIEKMEKELGKPKPEASLMVAPGRDSAMGVLTIRF